MKKHLLIATTILLLFFAHKSYSQYFISTNLSYTSFLGTKKVKSLGIGISNGFAVSERFGFVGGIDYFKSSKSKFTVDAEATRNYIDPQVLKVSGRYKLLFLKFHFGPKYYLYGGIEEELGVYAVGNLGLIVGSIGTTFDSYDKSNYRVPNNFYETDHLFGYAIELGGGIERDFSFAYLFADLRYNIPADRLYSFEEEEKLMPAFFLINAGVRIPFD